jgi:hypothetical protein
MCTFTNFVIIIMVGIFIYFYTIFTLLWSFIMFHIIITWYYWLKQYITESRILLIFLLVHWFCVPMWSSIELSMMIQVFGVYSDSSISIKYFSISYWNKYNKTKHKNNIYKYTLVRLFGLFTLFVYLDMSYLYQIINYYIQLHVIYDYNIQLHIIINKNIQ